MERLMIMLYKTPPLRLELFTWFGRFLYTTDKVYMYIYVKYICICFLKTFVCNSYFSHTYTQTFCFLTACCFLNASFLNCFGLQLFVYCCKSCFLNDNCRNFCCTVQLVFTSLNLDIYFFKYQIKFPGS